MTEPVPSSEGASCEAGRSPPMSPSGDAQRQHRGILRRRSASPEKRPPPEKEDKGGGGKQFRWDEANIEAYAAQKTAKMKITEPKTPFYADSPRSGTSPRSSSEEEEEESDSGSGSGEGESPEVMKSALPDSSVREQLVCSRLLCVRSAFGHLR